LRLAARGKPFFLPRTAHHIPHTVLEELPF
jgi:hypothetical protein